MRWEGKWEPTCLRLVKIRPGVGGYFLLVQLDIPAYGSWAEILFLCPQPTLCQEGTGVSILAPEAKGNITAAGTLEVSMEVRLGGGQQVGKRK